MRPVVIAMLLLAPLAVSAAGPIDWDMEPFKANLRDKPSLQRGAALYMNYCLGCHSLEFQRYEMTADFLEVPHDIFLENLVFSGESIGSQMHNAMPTEQAKSWFGAAPPDLTMVTRVRSATWVYNYLKTFYEDPSRPFGMNNKVFPNVGMPHAMLELQGLPQAVCRQVPMTAGNRGEMRDPLQPGVPITEEKCDVLEVVPGTGAMTAAEFDQAVYDVTNFLHYVAEPTRLERQRLGVYVILFLIVLLVLTKLLAREYHKEYH